MNKKNIRIPFWLQITLILGAGILASIAVWTLGVNRANQAVIQPELPHYTLTFAYQDGTIIDRREVLEGKGVFPPEIPCNGVFRGWSGPINQILSDKEVHPMIHTIGEDNLFYFHSVYVQEGSDFSLDLCLGGRVSISSGELMLYYDPQVMEYLQAECDGICTVTEAGDGELKISFAFDVPVREAMTLAKLNFKALEKNAYATEVVLRAGAMKVVTGEGEIPADCATINNKVYFLQEVES